MARLRLYSGFECSLDIATARYRACSRFVVSCVSCRARLSWVCLLLCKRNRNATQSDDALPIGLPQSDYLAHLVDYVYDSPQRLAHCLSCSRFCARWSNCVTADHPTTLRGFRSMQLADCVRIYLLSDRQIKYPHSAVRANASQTVRLMTHTLDCDGTFYGGVSCNESLRWLAMRHLHQQIEYLAQ
jgi:hypothetical protein